MFKKINKKDEELQMVVLYDNLVAAGKLKGDEFKQFVKNKKNFNTSEKYQAKTKFLKKQGAEFWDKINNYGYSPIELANQIYDSTMENFPRASATYLLTGISVTQGTVVCAGVDYLGNEVINRVNKHIKTMYTLTASDILMFILEHAKYKKEPLAMIGIWQEEYRPHTKRWVMAICHEVGIGWPDQYFTSYYDATFNEVIKSEIDGDDE